MLRGGIVQFLGDALALLLLQVDKALGKLPRLLLQRFALSDIRKYANMP